MVRDKWQTEITRSLSAWGLDAIKHNDYMVGAGGKGFFPANPGEFDVHWSYNGSSGYIEVKTGQGKHRQRFAFAQFDKAKRDWYERTAIAHSVPTWWTIVLGNRINGKKYPRINLFVPTELILQIEKEFEGQRKSIPYEYAVSDLSDWLLEWDNGTWALPKAHMFRKQYF